MVETRMQSKNAQDFKERFEFKFTMKNRTDGNDNIICQRYFKINSYNPVSARSYELAQTIRECGERIDTDLKFKTQAYLEIFAPQYFDSEEEMNKFFKNPYNRTRIRVGNGIVVRGNAEHDYFWTEEGPVPATFKFDDGELANTLSSDSFVDYKFAFFDGGREVCSYTWTGVYPRYVRNPIDLSNKRGRYNDEDLDRLSFEQYLTYKMVQGRSDLVYGIIKDICQTCSKSDNSEYTTKDSYTLPNGKDIVYSNRR